MSDRPASGPPLRARLRPSHRPVGADAVVLVALLALAALLRLPGLEARGGFDADEGRTMLTLESWVRDGSIPLLGPSASVGGVHHGALFYALLAPAAFVGGLDPGWVVAELALAGIATVSLVWFAARNIGGPAAGFVAGLLAAVSVSEVARSTSLWNPGIVPLGAALTVAAAWTAWSRRRPGAWLGAAVGSAVALQGHLLSALIIVPVWALALADLRRSRGSDRHRVAAFLAGAVGIVALTYVPLLVHELRSDFAETRALIAYLGGASGGERGADGLWTPVIVAIRTMSWSLVGLLTRAPELAVAVAGAIVVGTAWLAIRGGRTAADREDGHVSTRVGGDGVGPRTAARWLGGSLLVAVVGLSVAAPGLASVVEALPVDQYHAAADPLVLVLVGLIAGGVWAEARRSEHSASRVGRLLASALGVAVGTLLLWNLATQPPATAPDGGWPAAEAAARRISADVPTADSFVLRSLPPFTAPDAYTFALHAVGRAAEGPEVATGAPSDTTGPPPATASTALVVVCDDRFRAVVGLDCGGPAESAWLGATRWRLVDRFVAAPERVLSVYLSADAP